MTLGLTADFEGEMEHKLQSSSVTPLADPAQKAFLVAVSQPGLEGAEPPWGLPSRPPAPGI